MYAVLELTLAELETLFAALVCFDSTLKTEPGFYGSDEHAHRMWLAQMKQLNTLMPKVRELRIRE